VKRFTTRQGIRAHPVERAAGYEAAIQRHGPGSRPIALPNAAGRAAKALSSGADDARSAAIAVRPFRT
jgi:hypothetical protein